MTETEEQLRDRICLLERELAKYDPCSRAVEFESAKRWPAVPIRIGEVVQAVGEHRGVHPVEICGSSRGSMLAETRAIISGVTRTLTTYSYPEIARIVRRGRKGHEVICLGENRWLATDPLDQIDAIEYTLDWIRKDRDNDKD